MNLLSYLGKVICGGLSHIVQPHSLNIISSGLIETLLRMFYRECIFLYVLIIVGSKNKCAYKKFSYEVLYKRLWK